MRVNIKGLISRLDDLRERLNKLFEKLEKLDDLDYDIAVEDVEQYFQNDDAFNLSIALDVLEQAEKLDKALEIIIEHRINIDDLLEIIESEGKNAYWEYHFMYDGRMQDLTKEEFDFLKEVLL